MKGCLQFPNIFFGQKYTKLSASSTHSASIGNAEAPGRKTLLLWQNGNVLLISGRNFFITEGIHAATQTGVEEGMSVGSHFTSKKDQ